MQRTLSASALAIAALVAAGTTQSANAELIYGMTAASSQSTAAGVALVSFDSATPGTISNIGAFSGLGAGQTLRAMDFRPADGQLYAVGSVSATGAAQLYTVNISNATLTPVGSGFTITGTSQVISMDFNPVADRVRIVSRAGASFRVNPNTGALAATDTSVAYAAGDAQTGTPDTIGIAYTNNVAGATSTTLYAWDYNSDALFTIGSIGATPDSPNSGISHTVFAPSGFRTFGAGLGMDISGTSGIAYVSHDDPATGASMGLFSIDLATGAETSLGGYGSGIFISDISAAIPAPGAAALLGLAGFGAMRRRRN